ncbi:hypothetical protein TTHERM_00951740 (macronuclear) [Tetrahymena thermophila SB210]|uniref:Uncharacterized protein n=1 Tax=Tetrahymena thermophila (strain SB210) TaxID=312017 RepID=Q241Y0_TETTS|nr:hypothetical protein TTHERM_00951740 [Tetrahymena thermophila SB210]EAS02571.1 hypothetical protein TTHERM_00951740 [Tetrahymena thermophila SB210]|eukprot:XP_001022816.1 hypothetical protein TTHERM_00951740 [Tetrahymena thermophila SB210]
MANKVEHFIYLKSDYTRLFNFTFICSFKNNSIQQFSNLGKFYFYLTQSGFKRQQIAEYIINFNENSLFEENQVGIMNYLNKEDSVKFERLMQFAKAKPKPDEPSSLMPSVQFERLMHFAKAEPKPDAPSSPIQRRENGGLFYREFTVINQQSSVKFERLMQLAKAKPKPDAPIIPIQLSLLNIEEKIYRQIVNQKEK